MSDVRTDGFTERERAAIKERAAELRKAGRRGSGKERAAADEQDVLTTIADMPQPDRGMAERIHAIITTEAPNLSPKLWYGMPAYTRDGKVLCFFLGGHKDKTRYATLSFNEEANLDDGTMWPTSFALTELSKANEATIRALIKKAVS